MFLEGLEVVFIVLTFGSAQGRVPLAAVGAVLAVGVVGVAGLVVHQPLSRVPENTLKFGVGVMLTAFGIFWSGEGAVLLGLTASVYRVRHDARSERSTEGRQPG